MTIIVFVNDKPHLIKCYDVEYLNDCLECTNEEGCLVALFKKWDYWVNVSDEVELSKV